MAESKTLNDLGAGGEQPPKQGARPDLQEKMRRRYQNRAQAQASSAASQEGGSRQIPEGAEGDGQIVRQSTPGLDDPDANGNFIFSEGKSQSPKLARAKSGTTAATKKPSKPSPPNQDQFDTALDSVLGELTRDEKAKKKGQKQQAEPRAVFENNFDDEPSQGDPGRLNIPAARGAAGQRADPLQQMIESLMGGKPGDGHGGNDPIAALFGQGQDQGRNRGDGGMAGFERLLGFGQDGGGGRGGGQGQMRYNDPLLGLFGGGGRDPLVELLGERQDGDESRRRRQNENNNMMTTMLEGLESRRRNEDAMVDDNDDNEENNLVRGSRGGRGQGLLGADGHGGSEDDEDSYGDSKSDGKGKKKAPREDPVKAMLEEMTKGYDGKSSLLASLREAEKQQAKGGAEVPTGARRPGIKASMLSDLSQGKDVGGLGAFSGILGGGGSQAEPAGGKMPRGEDPMAQLMASMMGQGRGGRAGGQNPMEQMMSSLMGGAGGGEGGSDGKKQTDRAGRGGGSGALDPMRDTMAALMGGGRGRGEGGQDALAAMMSVGRGRGVGGQNPMADISSALMGGGRGTGSGNSNPLANMLLPMTGGGRGRGGGAPNPMLDMMSMLGGGMGRGGGGMDPMASLMGAGGAGEQNAMQQAIEAMMGSGGADQMAQMLGAGRGAGGPQEQLMRQMMESSGLAEEGAVNPETADDNEIIHQMLAYETMRAASNRAPKANPAMHTVIIVDTSGSMSGDALLQAGQFISQFLRGLEEAQFEYQLQENVALISCGAGIQVSQHFTNDYSLIRNATNSLCAEGPSRLHMGLILPLVLFSHGSMDQRRQGGVYQLNNHTVCPRIIFISDGHINPVTDVPGQQPRADDQMTLALQNMCVELTRTMVEKTLCKIYTVPVGNANVNFLQYLAQSSGGKMMKPDDGKYMSRCLLHHMLVSKLLESGQQKPSHESVTALLKQITAAADPDDIKGVFEALAEGEPDVAARDQKVAQDIMKASQERGQGRGAIPGAPDQGGQGMPGGIPNLGGMPAFGGMPGGTGGMTDFAKMLGGRGGIPGGGRGVSDLAGMLGEQGGVSGGGRGMPDLAGMLGGRGGMPDMAGMFGGQGGMPGGGRGMPDLAGILGGQGGIPGGGRGMPDLAGMLVGQGGIPHGGRGMPDLAGMLGGRGGMPNLGGMPGRGRDMVDLEVMIGRGRGSPGGMPDFPAMLGRGAQSGGSQERVPGGLQLIDENSGAEGSAQQPSGEGKGSKQMSAMQLLLGGQGGAEGNDLMGTFQKMLNESGGGGTGTQGGTPMERVQKLLDRANLGENGEGGQNPSRRNYNGQEYIEISEGRSQRWLGGFAGLLGGRGGAMPEGLMQMLHSGGQEGGDNAGGLPGGMPSMFGLGQAGGNLNAAGGHPLLGGLGGMGGGADNVGRGGKRNRVMFNNVPPMSFGVDEDGNSKSVDLMEGLGGDDSEGDELMAKLAEMLGIEPGAENDDDDDDAGPGGGILGLDAEGGAPNVNGRFQAIQELLNMQNMQRGQGQARNVPGMPNFPGGQGQKHPDNQNGDGKGGGNFGGFMGGMG